MVATTTPTVDPEALDEALLLYFSPDKLYDWILPGQGSKAKPFKKPCDPPTLAGFCSTAQMTLDEVIKNATPRILEICEQKLEHILLVNGLTRGYDATLTGLVLKNKCGYTEKSEDTHKFEAVISSEDKKLLARMGMAQLGEGGKLIDVSDSVRVN